MLPTPTNMTLDQFVASQTCSATHLFDSRMQATLDENLDIYVCAIEHEETAQFWTWFVEYWVQNILRQLSIHGRGNTRPASMTVTVYVMD